LCWYISVNDSKPQNQTDGSGVPFLISEFLHKKMMKYLFRSTVTGHNNDVHFSHGGIPGVWFILVTTEVVFSRWPVCSAFYCFLPSIFAIVADLKLSRKVETCRVSMFV